MDDTQINAGFAKFSKQSLLSKHEATETGEKLKAQLEIIKKKQFQTKKLN